MFAGDFTKLSGDTALDNDMVAYLNRVVEADTETALEQAQRDIEADVHDTDDLELQPAFGTQMAQAPQAPQVP